MVIAHLSPDEVDAHFEIHNTCDHHEYIKLTDIGINIAICIQTPPGFGEVSALLDEESTSYGNLRTDFCEIYRWSEYFTHSL